MTEINPMRTPADLDRAARDYARGVIHGGLGPAPYDDADVEAAMAVMPPSEKGQAAIEFLLDLGRQEGTLASDFQKMAACGKFEQQLQAHQHRHQISGLVEEPFMFEPLDLHSRNLRLGTWLELMPGGRETLQAHAAEVAEAFLAAANGPGKGWTRLWLAHFEDGSRYGYRRYVPGDFDGMRALAQNAAEGRLQVGSSRPSLEGADACLQLELGTALLDWDEEGDWHTFALARTDLAEKLLASGEAFE